MPRHPEGGRTIPRGNGGPTPVRNYCDMLGPSNYNVTFMRHQCEEMKGRDKAGCLVWDEFYGVWRLEFDEYKEGLEIEFVRGVGRN